MTATDPDTYHKSDKIFRLASWSSSLAWALLFIYLLSILGSLYQIIQNWSSFQGQNVLTDFNFWSYVLDLVRTLGYGGFLFLVLQGVSEGLYILMDIYDETLNAASAPALELTDINEAALEN